MTNLVHRAEVVRVERLTPGMTRVVLGGRGLDGFASTSSPDEYLRMWFPHPGETEPVLPAPAGAESWEYPDGANPAPMRTYTVRRWDADAGELTIDLVVHGCGLASAWAEDVRPGAIVGVNTPRGMYRAPDDMTWLLMVADAAALPAAARILEELPRHVRVRLYAEVPDAAHEIELSSPASAEVRWVHGGNGLGPSRLEEIVRHAQRPEGNGYVWVAGETRVMRGVRKHLRHELGLPGSAYRAVGYWTAAAERWTQRYEALPTEVRAHIEALWEDSGRTQEEIEDDYDRVLEQHGL